MGSVVFAWQPSMDELAILPMKPKNGKNLPLVVFDADRGLQSGLPA
jgi:hypothetical protein